MAGSVVKEDAAARGLPGGCKVSSVTGTYWMETYCQRRDVMDRVLHPPSALSPGSWCQNGRPSPFVNHDVT